MIRDQLSRATGSAARVKRSVQIRVARRLNARLLPGRRPYDYVFVVSGGRSGSTLVQGLLNAMPRTLVRGENSFFILPMFRAYQRTQSFQRQYWRNSTVTSAFYGLDQIDLGDFITSTRDLTIRQLLGTTDARTVDVLGFKEVRWDEIRPGETEAFFAFFEQVFPNARYVLNVREPEIVVDSAHWRRVTRQEALRRLARIRDVQQYLRETRSSRTYDTTFEVITGPDGAARDAQLKGLAEFVAGSCDEALLSRLHETLKVGHGPAPFGVARGRRQPRAR